MSNRIRLVIADDHALVVAAMRLMVERAEGVEVVAEANDGRQAIALAREHRPDIVVMDIGMAQLNGIEAAALIKAELPQVRVLIVSSHETEDYVRRAVQAGVDGYVVKGAPAEELAAAIQAVARGDTYLSPGISRHVMAAIHARGESPLQALTGRQREILQLIAEGRGTKEIAYALGISVKTAETHRAAIMERLGIHDVAGLALFAARHGLVDLERKP